MKKMFFAIIVFLSCINMAYANNKSFNVTFFSCIDGDTAKFIKNGDVITVRFLAIDTPETKHPTKGVEPYGKEASEFTCNEIKNAKKIKIEFDSNSDETDKYGRYLGWVFVDGNLLEKKLIEMGYAKVAYLYNDYKYTPLLQEEEKVAKSNKVGLWSDQESEENPNFYFIILIVVILLIMFIFSKKARKKIIYKAKKELKKQIKKNLN